MPKLTNEEINSYLNTEIYAAEQVRNIETLDNARIYERYRAKTMGNEVEGRSKIVSTDVFETVEWILPPLMDIYSPENGTPEYEPVGAEDVDAAKFMTELVRYQFWRQNEGETLLRRGIKDALMYRPGGIIKYCWEKAYGYKKHDLSGLDGMEVMMLENHPDVSITGKTESGYGYDVSLNRRFVEFDGPRFYLIPQHEFLRHPNARDINETPFCAHVKEVTVDYLRRMGRQKYYKNVEQAIEENQGGNEPVDYSDQVRYAQDGIQIGEEPSSDPARQKVKLYECYVDMDIDGDGLLEKRIITKVGSVILRNEENVYERPPFVILRPIEDTHKFSGITLGEMVEDLQRLNTFLLRQTIDNLAQSNNSRKVYDPSKINQADVLNNIPGAPIRTKSGVRPVDAIMEFPTQPIHASVIQFYGVSKEMGEQRTGVSKAMRSAGDPYNQTATGQLAAINQASQRVRMIAKIIAAGLSDLFRAMVFMNKTFLTEKVAVRLHNKFVQISPDDLEGRMDLVLNIVMGSQSRQQTIINMQQLLAIFGQLQTGGMPVLDANNLPNIIREIVKAMGYKNQDIFLPLMFQQDAKQGNQALAQLQTQNLMMGKEGGNGAGGTTIGSIAGDGTGGTATPNPVGAGLQSPYMQPGSGGMLGGMPS